MLRAPRIELGTYCVWGNRHNQLDQARLILIYLLKEMLDPGFEPGLPRPQRGVLTSRLIELFYLLIGLKEWRIRVSISVPVRC